MILHKQRIVFLHPTKTGGSSVEEALFTQEMKLCGRPYKTGVYHAYKKVPWPMAVVYGIKAEDRQHWTHEMYINRIYPFAKDWPVVITVRHPVERALSEFRYQWDGNCNNKHRNWLNEDGFEESLVTGKLWRNGYRQHGRPMSDYLPEDESVPVTVLRQETLAEDFSKFFPGLKLPHFNNSSPRPVKVTHTALDMIEHRWGADLEAFGYSMDAYRKEAQSVA